MRAAHEISFVEVLHSHDAAEVLLDRTVRRLQQQLAERRERVLEDFLASGAMLRDLSQVFERPRVSMWSGSAIKAAAIVDIEDGWRVR